MPNSGDEFDIVVIGGGSGGSAAAGRLSEGGKYSVCLIEAGEDAIISVRILDSKHAKGRRFDLAQHEG